METGQVIKNGAMEAGEVIRLCESVLEQRRVSLKRLTAKAKRARTQQGAWAMTLSEFELETKALEAALKVYRLVCDSTRGAQQ